MKQVGSLMDCCTMDSEAIRQEFDAMDSNGDGSLDVDEVTAVFAKMGKDVTKATVVKLIRLADEDGNGTIEWNEFEKICEASKDALLEDPMQPMVSVDFERARSPQLQRPD